MNIESPRMSVVRHGPDRMTITTAAGSRDWVPAECRPGPAVRELVELIRIFPPVAGEAGVIVGEELARELLAELGDAAEDEEGRLTIVVADLIEQFLAARTPGPDVTRLLKAAKDARDFLRCHDDPEVPFLTWADGAVAVLDQAIAEHEAAQKGAGG